MQYSEALNIIREVAQSALPAHERVPVTKACGRVVAEGVVSEITLPPFTNSAVDGFALPFAVSNGATASRPVRLKIAGTLFPGEVPREATPAGHAWRIMTGAPVPLDCNACAKVEDTSHSENEVQLRAPLARNENLRFKGTDYDRGTRVVSRGERLRPEHLMALASVGRTEVEVFKKPRVLLISTGKELVEPGTPLKSGEIYNSTRSFLATALEQGGCDVEIAPTMHDEPRVFLEFMRAQNPFDVVVTTGAVSMGTADFVRPALEELGARVLFHRVDIRPGKPILFAQLGRTVFFGLPGNPVSGVVGMRFFIDPFLRARTTQAFEKPFRAKLAGDFSKPRDLRCFFKAQLTIDDGEAKIHLMKGQPSYMVRPLLQSSVWAVLSEGLDAWKAGDLVEVYPQESTPHDLTSAHGELA